MVYLEKLSAEPFDYLFSINNFMLMPEEALSLPRRCAINFHDSPLPRYAGVNATNWAIYNREPSHGVTWHVMSTEVDTGDVLKQALFSLEKDETALSLNTRCYRESIACFAELVDDLASQRESRTAQDQSEWSYFGRWCRPPGAGIIDFTQPAKEIDALCRSLDFGTYSNPLCTPKLWLGESFAVVRKVSVLDSSSDQAPGTVLDRGGRMLVISTGSNDVCIQEATTLDGRLLETSGIDLLPHMDADQTDSITNIHQVAARHECYWTGILADLKPLDIPYRTKQRPGTTFSSISFPIAHNMSGDELMDAFAVYLSRVGGKREFDVAFGYSDIAGGEPFFAARVPLRIQVKLEQGFTEFRNSFEKQLEITQSKGTYLRDLVVREPLFGESPPAPLPICLIRGDDDGLAESDLVVVIPDDGNEIRLRFRDGSIESSDVERIGDQFSLLLDNRSCGLLGEMNIVPDAEREMLLGTWSGARRSFPVGETLAQRFEAQVERTPDAIALTLGNEELTYAELNRAANRLAHRLYVGASGLVGLFCEKSIDLVVGLLGIVKAGLAYLPLDPALPKERLRFMLEDADISVVLTRRSEQDRLLAGDFSIVLLDEPGDAPDHNPAPRITPGDLAYVIYTSGSTGKPKGVLVTHANVVRLFDATDEWFGFGDSDVWTLFHSYAFDFSVWEIWGALLYGGRLVVVPHAISRSPTEFGELLAKEKVTILNQTPSAFLQLIQADITANLSLRLVIFGGEALELRSLAPWIERHGDLEPRLVNMYGITETTVHVTYRRILADDVNSGQRSVIGVPIPDVSIHVLDEFQQPVPIGVIGELYVGGAGVARGYLNRPDLTAERFVEGLYRTGDLGRFLPNQDIEYIGRIDNQVQLRGFRVELSEIETALAEHPSVKQVVVLVKELGGMPCLVAYYVSDENASVEALREHLEQWLPSHMVPQHFVALDSIPLTSNGKIDQKALPMPELRRKLSGTYVPPQNEAEQAIVDIWKNLLGIDVIGSRDTFYQLGGHSLLFLSMLEELESRFSRRVSVVDLFRHPTVSSLAEFLSRKPDAIPTKVGIDRELLKKQKLAFQRQRRLVVVQEKRYE